MRRRIIVAAFVLLASALFVVPVLALDIHGLLSRDTALLTASPLPAWKAVLQIPQVGKLYFLLLTAELLGLVWILATGSNLKYRSDMQQITPDIQTPCAAGQGQYGTARWMPKKNYGKYFPVIRLTDVENMDELLQAGRKDKEKLQ